MTNYSGVELVKQESCKLTYATFLSDVVVCYDKVANKLVLNNPYFYETTYDETTNTLSNSGFSLRSVNLISHYGTHFVISLSESNTGLVLILFAGEFSRKHVIPYRHLTACDSMPCYDFGDDFKFCKEVSYKEDIIWPCSGLDREFRITDETMVDIEDKCIYFTCYDFNEDIPPCKAIYYKEQLIWECSGSEFDEPITDINNPYIVIEDNCADTHCYDPDPDGDGEDIPFCMTIEYDGDTLWPCYDMAQQTAISLDDPGVEIIDNCDDYECYDTGLSIDDIMETFFCKTIIHGGKEIPPCYGLSQEFPVTDDITIDDEDCDSFRCYDFSNTSGTIIKECENVTYNGETLWPCYGTSLEVPVTDINEVIIEDNCDDDYMKCYNFSASIDRELNYTEKVIYKGKEIYKCYDSPDDDDDNNPLNCEGGTWIEGGPTIGVWQCPDGRIVITDDKYIVDTCKEEGKVSTPMGCQEEFISISPCDSLTGALSINEAPTLSYSFGMPYNGLTSFDSFILKASGNIIGEFHDDPSEYANTVSSYGSGSSGNLSGGSNSELPGHTMRINLFNIYDYLNIHAYEEGSTKGEISIANFIFHKYLEGTDTKFTGDSGIDNKLTQSELMTIFPSLENATFNWSEIIPQYFGKSIGHRAPCKYKEIDIHNSPEQSRVVINYMFTNNFISRIESTGINATELQADYDLFCDKAKWLLTSKAYAYAVYQGYLDPDTPLDY